MGNKKLLTRIAEEMIERICDRDGALGISNLDGQSMYSDHSETVRATIKVLKPATLGRLCAQGKGLYHIHMCTWLDKYGSGRSLLREIAVTAVIAEMVRLANEHDELSQEVQALPI